MASPKVRGASIYAQGRKVAELESNDYEINGGDEAQFGDPGYSGHSDGATTTKLSAKGFVPVSGMSFDLAAAVISKETLDMTIALVNGKIHQVPMRAVSAKFSSSHKSGTQMGDFSFEGGEPSILG